MSFVAIDMTEILPYELADHDIQFYKRTSPDVENQLAAVEEYLQVEREQATLLAAAQNKLLRVVISGFRIFSKRV